MKIGGNRKRRGKEENKKKRRKFERGREDRIIEQDIIHVRRWVGSCSCVSTTFIEARTVSFVATCMKKVLLP